MTLRLGWMFCLGIAGAMPLIPLAAAPADAAAGPAVSLASEARAEALYADWLDALGAVSTIRSGLAPTVGGHGFGYWQERVAVLRAELDAALVNAIRRQLGGEDARALDLMRKNVAAAAQDASAAPDAEARCKDRDARSSGRGESALRPLQHALLACFIEIGNALQFDGKTLVRTTALQRLQELRDEKDRKRLFLAFAPLWTAVNGDDAADSPYRRMIKIAAEQARTYARSAIGDAAAALGITPQQVEQDLLQILVAWREQDHGAAIEPWNYWYRWAPVSRELADLIPRNAVLAQSKRFYRDLGADLDRLGVLHDLDVRIGKTPYAYADHVRIGRRIGANWRPAIPRVSANYETGGLFVLNELIHEDGHAVHDAALRVRPAFYSLGDDLFLEAVADVPAWSTAEPAWQQRYLGRSAAERPALSELFSSVVMDAAWGLFELRLMQNPAADPNALWTDITSRYLNIRPHPEWSWWALRVQLVDSPGYMINYGLGAMLTADIRKQIRTCIGPFDAGNPRWYAWISAHLLRYGASIETTELLRRFLGRPVSPDALLEQLRRGVPGSNMAGGSASVVEVAHQCLDEAALE
jgi:hypothetical protein